MADIFPISIERHGSRVWSKPGNYGWARQDQVVPVVLQEATYLLMTLPLAFLQNEGKFQFFALMGLRPGENLWVGEDGRSLLSRVPVVMQLYPFRLLRDTRGQAVLGINEAGLLPPGTTEGQPLFDKQDKPVAQLATILEQLGQREQDWENACKAASVLDQHGLIEPWDLQIQGEGGVSRVEGLFRVNEKKMNELPAEALLILRNTGALLMAYCQLLSMQHIQQLARMAEAQAKVRLRAEQAQTAAGKLGGDHGIISFSNL